MSTPLPSACTLPVTRAMASSFTHKLGPPPCAAGGPSLDKMIDHIHTLSAQRQEQLNVMMSTDAGTSSWLAALCTIRLSSTVMDSNRGG